MCAPRQVGAWAVLLALLASPATSAPDFSTCTAWVASVNESCVKEATCSITGNTFYLWEDCVVNSEIFTVVPSVTLAPSSGSCPIAPATSPGVILSKDVDAEKEAGTVLTCTNFLSSPPPDTSTNVYIDVENVNEYFPLPVDQGLIVQFEPYEEQDPGVIGIVKYQDEDFEETENLAITWIDPGHSDIFEMDPVYNPTTKEMDFELKTKKKLDFEIMTLYNLDFTITSTDGRGLTKETDQTVQVYVQDISDTPPYWTKFYPSYTQEECVANTPVFTIEARDRDIMINNEIRYSIISGNDEGYFEIDEMTGELTTILDIDREALSSPSFTLEFEATEYNGSLPTPEADNSVTQVSIIFIGDLNDNQPTFDKAQYELEMPEVSEADIKLDLTIFVADMDEGANGTFKLVTSSPADLMVAPVEGRLNQSLTLTATWKDGNTYFDYEQHNGTELIFEIRATEVADDTHTSTVTLKITLTDVNDNIPQFTQPGGYPVNFDETRTIGTEVLTVAATDGDVSADIGTQSIRYVLDDECSQLEINETTGTITTSEIIDYESSPGTISCTITAADNEGNGNSADAALILTIIDVVDETPQFNDVSRKVSENKKTGEYVGSFTARDEDDAANVTFIIDWSKSQATKQGQPVSISLVNSWFVVTLTYAHAPEFNGDILVGDVPPDREVADEVVLTIIATDNNTEEGTAEVEGKSSLSITEFIIDNTQDNDVIIRQN